MNAARAIEGSTSPHAGRDLSRLRETSGRVVGSLFFGTLLKAMRESTLKGQFGHGGRGEEVFAGQLHQLLAERLGESLDRGPQEAMVRRLQRQQALVSASKFAAAGAVGREGRGDER
jgi:hypothetical protein